MNDKDDIIIKVYRKRLKDLEQPVGKDIWADIERDLQVTTPKHNKIRWMWTGVAASVLIAIVSGLFLLPERNTQIPVLAKKEQQEIITKETTVIQKNGKKHTIEKSLYAENKKVSKKASLPLKKETIKDTAPEYSDISGTENPSSTTPVKQESQKEKANNKVEYKSIPADQDADLWSSIPKKKKKKRNMSYALGIGNSGSFSESSTSGLENGYACFDPTFSEDGDKVIGNLVCNDIGLAHGNKNSNTTYNYTPPVSVGFSIRKHLTDYWALESGLTYTYLSSRETTSYANSGLQKSDIALHYVGIPVKGIFSFYNTNRISIYLTAGGLVEKSVYGQEKITVSNHSSIKELNIPELQWSVSGNVGVNYRLAGHFGLFVETGVSYYWDDQSDVMTVRKDSPTNLNLQGGIRLTY